MTLKASIAELALSPAELKLSKARQLYIRLATEKERLECNVAELRLESAKRQPPRFNGRTVVRAEADLTAAQKKLIAAAERAAADFDEAIK